MGSTIIFNGDEIVARFIDGQTRYLLITFMGALHEHEAETRYLLKEFVESNGVNCIGISTKVRGFYRGEEIQQALAAIHPIRNRFSQVIVMGLSMGAYAAIKYSGALRADSVVAFSPFYSLDVDELDLTPKLRADREHLLAHSSLSDRLDFSKMAPRPDEVSGAIFIIYASNYSIDRHSAMLLRDKLPGTVLVPLNHISHLTTEPFFNQPVLFKLIDALISGTSSDVRHVFLSVARRRASFAVSVLREAAHRKPGMVLRALRSSRLGDSGSQDTLRDSDVGGKLMYEFALRGEWENVHQLLIWGSRDRKRVSAVKVVRESIHPLSTDTVFLLLSFHGRLVFFDVVLSKVVQHAGFASRDSLRPLAVTGFTGGNGQISCFYKNAQGEIPVQLDPEIAGPYELELVASKIVTISGYSASGEKRYLRADGGTTIGLHADAPSDWERFVLLEVSREYLVHETAVTDSWLDKALARSATETRPPVETTVARREKIRSPMTRFWANLLSKHDGAPRGGP